MADLTIEQVRSAKGSSPRQRDTLRSLKLGRIGKRGVFADSPQLRGMVDVVSHLIVVSEGSEEPGAKSGAKSTEGDS